MRTLIFHLMLAVAASAGAPDMPFVLPLEISVVLGHPIIKVKMVAMNGATRECRMLLDTGASMALVDRTVPSEFWAPNGEGILARGSMSVLVEAEPVRIHRLQIGPIEVQQLEAAQVDLEGINRFEDIPIDGVIGMNLLRGRRFQVDFQAHEMRWGGPVPEGLLRRPLRYAKLGSPMVQLVVGGHKVEAWCDTGSDEFLALIRKDAGVVRMNTQSVGIAVGLGGSGQTFAVDLPQRGVTLGSKAWCNPDVTTSDGQTHSLLGNGAFWPSVWFDFKGNEMGLVVGPEGCLASAPPIHAPVWVFWDRSGDHPQLKILGVKPGSPYEAAGLTSGDILIEAGALKGPALGIRSLRDTLGPLPITMVVQRQGKTISMNIR